MICGVAAAIGWGGLERRVRSEFAQVSETHLLPTAMLWTQALVPELSLAECSKSIGTVSNSSLYEDCLTQELRSVRRGGKRSPELAKLIRLGGDACALERVWLVLSVITTCESDCAENFG